MTLHAGRGAVDAFGPGPDPRYAWPMLVAGARACAGAAATGAETAAGRRSCSAASARRLCVPRISSAAVTSSVALVAVRP